MTQQPDFIPTHCDGCDEPLMPLIQVCSCCEDKYVVRLCNNCKRVWGYDYNLNEWVELEEVKDE